ncbi:SF3a splicing factor complex subunit [Podila horticola]|nr:SF3a splicing factor complex subunit [Podila horticola]
MSNPPPLPSAISNLKADEPEAPSEDAPVGFIYPPPYIREIADKTAAFVSGSGTGAQLEERLRQSEKNNAKFSFLNPTDPFHAYYQFKVQEAKSGNAPKAAEIKAEVEAKVEEAIKPPPEEPPQLEFMTPMPSVSAQDLEIMKLTAQFVARNGRQFMVSLAQKEARNYQFDFLRPNHSLFNYFSKLVEQYTKILVPSPAMLTQIEARARNKFEVQDIVMKRVEYSAYQQELRKKRDEKADAERMAFLMINWQDFVVVETIEFTEADDALELPLPKSLKELENMSLAQKRMVQVLAESEHAAEDVPQDIEIDDDNDSVDMEGSDDEMEMAQEEVRNVNEIVMTAPTASAPMKIKEDYVPKAFKGRTNAALEEPTQICPRCGEKVKVSEMDEHVRVELLDPRFKELREIADAKTKASNMVSDGTDVARNLNMLKAHRTDIFSEEEQTRNAEEERRRQKEKEANVWDGQTTTVALTAQRNAAAAAAAAASAGAASYGQPPVSNVEAIGPQVGQAGLSQPPLYRQPGTYNQTYRMHPGAPPHGAPSMPPGMAPPGMAPPGMVPGMVPPVMSAPGYYPGAPGPAPGLPQPPASAHLPPRPMSSFPPGSAPGSGSPMTPGGAMPTQTPPAGRHPEDEMDRDSKRFKSEHNSPLPSSPAVNSPLPPQSQAFGGPSSTWITLDIQFADSDIKPEWNRDKLSTLPIENLVIGTRISTVKDRILAATGFPVGKQKLILPDGTVAKNQSTLGEYGFRIGQRSELQLAVKK